MTTSTPRNDPSRTRLVHPDGGAVVCEWPMEAERAAALLMALSELGFEFDNPRGGARERVVA